MAEVCSSSIAGRDRWRRWLGPSLGDVFLVALLAALFGRQNAMALLLWDGDTGWHIRTGEYILQQGTVPVRDLFSFSRPQGQWFAWEWLSDVIWAAVFRLRGLEAVVILAAALVCIMAVLLFLWLLRRGAGLWISGILTLAAVSASSVHFLARPHLFTLLLLVVGLWLLDEDRRRHTKAVWLAVPLAAVWANLHGGFLIWVAVLALLAVSSALERNLPNLRRYSVIATCAAAATLLNPYGWELHRHILGYLGNNWILNRVTEFQSPQIRSESMVVFAILLLAGTALAVRAMARGQCFEPLLVWCLGFAALRSSRHVPLYALASAPVIAGELAVLWQTFSAEQPPGAVARTLWEAGVDFARGLRVSVCGVAAAIGLLAVLLPGSRLADFPDSRFPVAALTANRSVLAPAGAMPRILTSDQWADYLIFHLYPDQRVFFDGRSDFYGAGIGSDYVRLLEAAPGWQNLMVRYAFDLALLPRDWPLARVLEDSRAWDQVYRDREAILFRRRGLGLKQLGGSADLTCIGWKP
jgi:hypothetical protein